MMLVTDAYYTHEQLFNIFESAGADLEEADRAVTAYREYLGRMSQKRYLAKDGKTAWSDSQRDKVYRAERKFECKVYQSELDNFVSYSGYKEAGARLKAITSSKTWKNLVVKYGGVTTVHLKTKKRVWNSRFAGRASYGWIQLDPSCGLDEYVLLHELAHCAGNMHHDISFRECLVKLVSRFKSRAHGQLLKKTFKEKKLKVSINKNMGVPKDPLAWFELRNRMALARKGRS